MKPTPQQEIWCRETARTMKALAHPTRLWLVEQLADGERCVCELLEGLELDISTVSKHLLVLKQAGVVSDVKRGKQVFYTLRCPCVLTFTHCLEPVTTERKS